jgi:hypothetical protein
MSKLLLCLLLSVFAASLVHKWEWERTARADWKQLAIEMRDARCAIRDLSGDSSIPYPDSRIP